MYLTFPQVILVQDQRKRKPEDDIVYVYSDKAIIEGNERHDRTLWPDPGNFKEKRFGAQWPRFTRYGTVYQDTSQNWCVIPDMWSWDDAHLAKQSLPIEEHMET